MLQNISPIELLQHVADIGDNSRQVQAPSTLFVEPCLGCRVASASKTTGVASALVYRFSRVKIDYH